MAFDSTSIEAGGDATVVDVDERRESGAPRAAVRRDAGLAAGAAIARYVVLGRLGTGGMGSVYKAYDPSLDRAVAVKVLAGGGRGEAQDERMVREAQALAQVAHPNVIAVHDVGTFDGAVYLAMEFVPGLTLSEWLRAEPRRPDAILRVLRQAGEGLAAAHRAGLVHRDFKGANVIVGDDGRVRVLDFGLARSAGPPEARTSSTPPAGGLAAAAVAGAPAARPSGRLVDVALTRADQLVGTPRYMAPEQHLGQPLSPATDQFSFCVVLWEALTGEHPFGASGDARLEQALAGVVRPGPGASRLPRGVRRALERGLRAEPGARWPTMAALLAELRHRPGARRRALAALGAALAVAGAAAAGAAARGRGPEPCTGGEARLSGAWDERTAAAVGAAFERSGWPGWRDGFGRVRAALDAYAGRWVAAQRDACRATRVTGVASEEQLERRMACLDRRLAEVRTATGLLAGADRELATRAAELVGSLGDVDACDGSEASVGGSVRPSDPAVRAEVDALYGQIGRAAVLREAGRVPDARRAFEASTAEARRVGYAPLLAESLLRLGEARARDGDGAGALDAIDEGVGVAGRAAADELFAQGLLQRAEVLTGAAGRPRDALELQPVLAGAVERAGAPPRLRYRLHLQLERTYDELGKYDDALAHAREAVQIAERSFGPDAFATATALRRLASTERLAGAKAEARRHAADAVARLERQLGPDHPGLYEALLDAASADTSAGDLRVAEATVRRALALYGAALPEHPNLANGYRRLGANLHLQGRFAEAEEALERAAALVRRAPTPDAMTLADVYAWLGDTVKELRGLEAARPHYAEVRAQYRASGRVDDPFLGETLALWGEAECKARHPARAAALFDEARPILAPRRDRWSVKLLVAEAECLVATRRARAAVALASKAVAELGGSYDPADTADAHFVLARALWATGARRRALAEAGRAAALIEGTGRKRADEVRAWVAARRR
ncbi:MAG TPA: serine/threonine-protein kinase [Polyangiaceae bacterium]|nr:serine/threonine-protein kinase [Polyangiaceae bacterium]